MLTTQEDTRAMRLDRRLLTRREHDVVRLVAQGHTNRAISQQLIITEGTARVYVERILSKLDLHSRVQLAVWAIESGLTAQAE